MALTARLQAVADAITAGATATATDKATATVQGLLDVALAEVGESPHSLTAAQQNKIAAARDNATTNVADFVTALGLV